MKRVVVNMATSRKERFKLYKAKKRWLIAGLAFAGVAMMSGGQVSADQVSDAQVEPAKTAVSTQPDPSAATGAVVTPTSATLTTDATKTESTDQEAAAKSVSTPAPATTTTTPVAATTEVSTDKAVTDKPAVQPQATTQAPAQSTTAPVADTTQDNGQQATADTNTARTWDYATDTAVQTTVKTKINGVENDKGSVVADGGDFTQSKSGTARVMNGYSVTVSIDNTHDMYHKGDTIRIPIYGEMESDNKKVDTQLFDVVSANGTLTNSGKAIGTYSVEDGYLSITLSDELLGSSDSTLNITGTSASPVASTAIWFNGTGSATVHFGNDQVSGKVSFVAGTDKGKSYANTTQGGYSKSDTIGVQSYFQDNNYLKAIYNGDLQTAISDEAGKFGTEDLVQIQTVTINAGTVKAVTSNRAYANFWVPMLSGDKYVATSVTAASITLNVIEQEVKSNFDVANMDPAALEAEVAKSLKSAGIGAYSIIKLSGNQYLLAYNIGNPYKDYSTEKLSKNPANDFADFLANGKNQGNLTAEQLDDLQNNIDYATAGKLSVGAGSVVHIFDVAFADNGTKNSLSSKLDTYNVDGVKLSSTGTGNPISTTPDTQNFNGQAQLKVLYVDAHGNPLAPTVTKLATPDTPYNEHAMTIPGYTLETTSGITQGVFGAANSTNSIVFTYVADDQKVVYNVVDDTDTKTLVSNKLFDEGVTADKLTKTEADLQNIANEYVKQGYVIVSVDKVPGVFDNDDKTDQVVYIHLKHATTTVTPDNPGTPGAPVDPANPDGPKWPAGTDKTAVDVKVNETVHYVYKDRTTAAADVTDAVEFTRTATVDEVTGEVTYTDWTAVDGDNSFDTKVSPVITGYVADKANVAEVDGLTSASKNVEETVTYSKLGSYVPELPDGSTPSEPKQYPNNPTDPSKPGTDVPAMPYVPGYTPENPDGTPLTPVDPEDPSKGYNPPAIPDDPTTDTVIKYEGDKQNVVYNVIDDTTGEKLATNVLFDSGDTGVALTKGQSDLQAIADAYAKQGYDIVSVDKVPGVFDNDDKTNQVVYIHLKHATTTVTPDNPGTPGAPVDPANPDGPKWPAGTDKTAVDVKVNETVHYVYKDRTTAAADVTDAVEFPRTATVDEVTGEVTYTDWTAVDGDNSFDTKVSPVITGYVADKANVAEVDGLTSASKNVEETVTYSKLGSYVPELPDGSTPSEPKQYPNDPTDPSKPGTDVPAMPHVPGYTPVGPDGKPLTPVDPQDPSKGYNPPAVPSDPTTDTVIKYGADKQNVVYNVINDTTGENLVTNVVFDSGDTDAALTKGQADLQAIADAYIEQGYDVVSVDTVPGSFDDDDTVDQIVNIHLKNKTATAMVPNEPIRVATAMVPNEPMYATPVVVPNGPVNVPTSAVTGDNTTRVGKAVTNTPTKLGATSGSSVVITRADDNAKAKNSVATSNTVSLPDTAAKGNQDENALLVALAVIASLLTFGFVQKRK